MLAEKTGWSMDYILWEMPISLINQFEHVSHYSTGGRCRQRGDKDKLMESLDNLMNMYGANNLQDRSQ